MNTYKLNLPTNHLIPLRTDRRLRRRNKLLRLNLTQRRFKQQWRNIKREPFFTALGIR